MITIATNIMIRKSMIVVITETDSDAQIFLVTEVTLG